MSAHTPREFDRNEREIEFSRALAFSDGVFAFAVTLLVTTIDVPDLSGPNIEHQLFYQLDDLLPFVFSYFLSFAVIGLLWLRHHRLFSRIHRLDAAALWLNILLLSLVALMPFSTGVIGRYGDQPAGVGIYALNLALASLAYTALWWHCARKGMLGERLSGREMRLELCMRLVVPFGFLLSVPIAFIGPGFAQATWGVILFGQRVVARRLEADGRIEPGDVE